MVAVLKINFKKHSRGCGDDRNGEFGNSRLDD